MTERRQIARPRDTCIYRPGTQSVPYFAAPKVLNRPHAVTADADIPADDAEGVLLCQGPGIDYQAPFRFTGTLHAVTVDLSGELITDSEADMRIAMARQ
jgi:hypothetical protein